MEGPYPIPDPMVRPDSFLTLLYKVLKCIEFDDRNWDKIYFGRCNKRMSQLLENLGYDVVAASRCMKELKERFESDNISWTIETVLKYSFEWKAECARKTDRDCMKRLLGAYGSQLEGLKQIDPSGVLNTIMGLTEAPKEIPSVINLPAAEAEIRQTPEEEKEIQDLFEKAKEDALRIKLAGPKLKFA